MMLTILIVEDDPATRELMGEILRTHDVEVESAADGLEALKVIKKKRYDGIFLDLQMPRIDGIEVAQCVRKSQLNRWTPIVIVTGSDDHASMKKAFAAGGTFFLQKPIQRQQLSGLFMAARGSMEMQRKRAERVHLEMEVVCQLGFQTIRGTSQNINLRGMLFDPRGKMLPVGGEVRLTCLLPSQVEYMTVQGKVMKVNKMGLVEIRFSSLNRFARECIKQLSA